MRARNIKPGFFKNEELAEIDAAGRLLFVGLWCLADREGRLEDRPKRIRVEIFPYDSIDVGELLDELAERGFIIRYAIDGGRFIQVVNFLKHQTPHYKESPSVIPAPPGWQDSEYVVGALPETKRQEILDRDGGRCLECGATEDLTIDHIVPRSKGGTHDDDNLRTLCRRCNSAKNNRLASADRRPIIGLASAEPGAALATDSLIPDSLIPDTPLLKPDSPLPARARAREPVVVESPYGFVDAFLDELGADERPPQRWIDEQCKHAQRLLEDGCDETALRALTRFALSQTWRDQPLSIKTLIGLYGDWVADGRPERAKSRSPNGRGGGGETHEEYRARHMAKYGHWFGDDDT
jgi:hypothetical protein